MALAVACAAVVFGSSRARADDNKPKKPGLFEFERWKSPVAREREAAQQLAPGTLDLTPARGRPAEPRPIRLRLYADRDYQSLVMRWQMKARAQIARINAVVEPVFGVRFEIESMREWDRSHFGAGLEAIEAELETLDPAKDVDLVVGFATPFRGVAMSIHQLGLAHLCSRHFVMRGMDDEQESLALDQSYKLLSPEERQRLYADRKAHKEVVVFLHEWGHTLGLLHHEDRGVVMNPAYDPQQRGFSDFEKQLIMLVVDRRLSHRDQPFPESQDLATLVANAPSEEGSDADRHDLLALVRAGGHGWGRRKGGESGGEGGAARGTATELAAADVDAFNRAVDAVNAGRGEEAWALLAPVMRRASEHQTSPEAWRRLTELAAATGALSAAEDAATRMDRADPALQKLTGDLDVQRQRVALPPNAAKLGVPPEREAAYVSAYRATAHEVATVDVRAARERAEAFAATFPGTPGADILSCEVELRARHAAAATKRCEAALAKFRDATRAHYLLGIIAAQARRDPVAEQHLRRAILLDPTEPNAWRALAAMYRQSGAKQRLSQLADEHQALLSSPLPSD
jgi:hypothetical protein